MQFLVDLPLTPLLIVWGAITVIFIGLMIYKSMLGLKEEDIVILDEAEQRMVEEQQQIIAKIQKLESIVKWFGIASGVLILLIGALWIYQGIMKSF